ncbi:MAG: HEAT repeat domain-containing protein [Myxococcota bacterium]
MTRRRWVSVSAGCLLGASVGCVCTDVESRRITRLGPLRGAVVSPAALATPLPETEAPLDVLDTEERRQLMERLEAHVRDVAAAAKAEGNDESASLGTLRVDRCTLFGAAQREATYYEARCWVSLDVDGEAVARVEARARRRTPARGISAAQAQALRAQQRSPLLALEHSEGALRASLSAAVRLLLLDATTDEPTARVRGLAESQLVADARARVLSAEGTSLASACVDLARYGRASDGGAVSKHLTHPHPLVRRACADAAGELGANEAREALLVLLGDNDDDVVQAATRALRRLDALYPMPEARPGPSKSSTEGASEQGTTPAERKTPSM